MLFEWDEAKQLKNLERHNLDFEDADIIFGGPIIVADAKTIDGERRQMATGRLDDVYVTAIYTMRNDVIRLISLRRARDEERKQHQKVFSKRT